MRCGRCGNENDEGNRFCGMCGATLVEKDQGGAGSCGWGDGSGRHWRARASGEGFFIYWFFTA